TPATPPGFSLQPLLALVLPRADAGAGRVRPLVLVAVAAGADERRGRPGALVVGLLARGVEPGGAGRIGHGLAGLVADEVLFVLHVRPTGDLAAAATRIGLNGVLGGRSAAADPAMVRAVGQARAAAGGARTVRRVGRLREDDFIDGAGVVAAMARRVGGDLGADGGVGDVGRRGRGVEQVGGARAEVGQRDGAVAAAVLRDGVVLAGRSELVAEGLQGVGVREIGRGGVGEGRSPENED